ncbi:ring finger protein 114 [Phyllostomus discolor]|uniref:Ring finger protein 114 n=1 Tax=Phyllostomus discolor TaxID=89673 RepID=A0A834DMP3_9CHIR|nr:ring finger protein 114 [Phyllostomus discolor]
MEGVKATTKDASLQPRNVPNRYTFPCPYCPEKNFDQEGLVEHCKSSHSTDTKSVPTWKSLQLDADPGWSSHLLSYCPCDSKIDAQCMFCGCTRRDAGPQSRVVSSSFGSFELWCRRPNDCLGGQVCGDRHTPPAPALAARLPF